MKRGTVRQRHTPACPRKDDGSFAEHRCRGPWGFLIDSGRTVRGQRRQYTRDGFATKKEAKAALDEFLSRETQGIRPTKVTVGEYLDQWLESKRSLRPGTRKSYREHIDHHLKPAIGHLQLSELQPEHLDRMLTDLLRKKHRNRKLTVATVRRIHATLRTSLNSGVKRRLIPYNPALAVELPVERRDETTVWTAEQVRTFLTATARDPMYPLYRTVALTGLRRGEAAGLRWIDVDLDAGTLHVTRQVVQLGGQCHVGPPKTRSGKRVVPLDPDTVGVLRSHKEAQEATREELGPAWADSGLVFTREDGTMLVPETISRRFRSACRRSGVPVIRFHDLRHTSASLALHAGVPLRVVSDRLGHSTIGITADLYTHVLPTVARDAADAIGALVATEQKLAAPAPRTGGETNVGEMLANDLGPERRT